MMLIEETTLPDAALPVDQFKAHLRLGTGFGGDSLQDEVLMSFLRAAMAAIEARIGKVLIERSFSWTLNGWRDRASEVLPVAPVTNVTEVVLVDALGDASILDAGLYRLEKDSQRPRLRPVGNWLPNVAIGGEVRISFDAGFATDWGGLPADLGHAVLMLATHYYEYRHETKLSDGCMPFGVTSLIQRYRLVRVSFGAVQ